ncbi:prevent-host-death protein [Rodentibacter ratti]|uniref:Antitoxin n=1 Tax=Rodentibacter ratti TaxID=1906745 RepID=A0A1V3L5V9_9PAST|nr:type II toxin-antitoxin system prevent-host-death family antitoxin [Rodentibacter ratti]OOF85316.1 prevent-host-death protein [Rodentibacter ratti]OOF89546.1 prevent-host-death protein [Rodentibacter ratti]
MKTLSIPSVNIHEAKTNLSSIVENVRKFGKPMIIAKAGKPQVKIVPLDSNETGSRFGFMKATNMVIPDDFAHLYQDEIIDMFEGSDE